MLKKLFISNFKIFESFTLELNSDLNIVVGDNESGKSTILEAINLALTKRLNGRLIDYELSPYLFNKKCTDRYIDALRKNLNPVLPKILIELYFSKAPELEILRGSINSDKTDAVGIRLEIAFDEDYRSEYAELIKERDTVKAIPTEYYKVRWFSFGDQAITTRGMPIDISFIDAANIRLQSGVDYYIQNMMGLKEKERASLSVAYRGLKEKFTDEPSIKVINARLMEMKGSVTDKDLAISIDTSQKTNWESNLIPWLDNLPFNLIGKGEQSVLRIMLALERKARDSDIILIEEPENNLSFSCMSKLISKVKEKCGGKQIIITTHSAYVLNKLGIDKVILLHAQKTTTLRKLPADTQNYFEKLSGYDTLRLMLARKAILVEGPSDELIVQKAYMLSHANRLPIEDGIDVINVRGLSFARFLDIARELEKEVVVVTDNDGNYAEKVKRKYEPYSNVTTITICADDDNNCRTLEPQIIKANSLEVLNTIFNSDHRDAESMRTYMESNKTECALQIFKTNQDIKMPEYVQRAIS
jgi:predicted ATPase